MIKGLLTAYFPRARHSNLDSNRIIIMTSTLWRLLYDVFKFIIIENCEIVRFPLYLNDLINVQQYWTLYNKANGCNRDKIIIRQKLIYVKITTLCFYAVRGRQSMQSKFV